VRVLATFMLCSICALSGGMTDVISDVISADRNPRRGSAMSRSDRSGALTNRLRLRVVGSPSHRIHLRCRLVPASAHLWVNQRCLERHGMSSECRLIVVCWSRASKVHLEGGEWADADRRNDHQAGTHP
jgi:hypothetical protein